MDNQEIRDEIRRRTMDLPVPESLHPDQIEKKLENHKKNKKPFTKRMRAVIAAAACLTAFFAAGSVLRPVLFDDPEYNGSSHSIISQTTAADSSDQTDTTYEEICDAINSFNNERKRDSLWDSFVSKDSTTNVMPEESSGESNDIAAEQSASENNNSAQRKSGDYSETDTQVDGVMEGDIVKTDGKHIFTIKDSTTGCTVTIFEARGGSTEELSQFTIDQADCREMYIEGTTLIVTGNLWDRDVPARQDADGAAYEQIYSPANKSHITLYDISTPSSPKGIRQLTQSGEFNTSRISDGYLYTFTNYSIDSSDNYTKERPEEYVPELNGSIMKSEKIRLLDNKGANSYMVMTSLKLSGHGKFTDSQAVLGKFDTHYMNRNHIYAVSQNYRDYNNVRSTILKYTYEQGKFSFHASAKIRGAINNSYYMHEYRDNFVFVYTRTGTGRDTNGLCVMNENLTLTGEISDLGVNETIYASYFIENMAYFVTYRNTDPVFAVDISNPKKPVLKSELKLPGFSSYLHSFGENMLIGIGQGNEDPDGDPLEDRVKLSLFSISRDYKLRETDKALAAADTASYADENHKSVFVDEERGLIGLGIMRYSHGQKKDSYDVYQCKKGKLKKVLSVPLSESSDISYVRGLRIGNCFYIVDTMGEIEIYNINTWKKAK